MIDNGFCACGCGLIIEKPRRNKIYACDKCRIRAFARRRRARLKAGSIKNNGLNEDLWAGKLQTRNSLKKRK